MTDRYLFIERDGGLLLRGSPADDGASDLRLQPDCLAALRAFAGAGYGLVLLVDPATAGAAGDATEAAKQAFVVDLCSSQSIPLAGIEQCRHGGDCDCKLPGIGLVAAYIANSALNRAESFVVGNSENTAALARAMGLGSFRIGADGQWPELEHRVLDRPRRATAERETRETRISIAVDLDRAGEPRISTGIGFFDHMLEQLGKHGGFELSVSCDGDLEVDEHHTVEDVALVLGQALREALGDKRGIGRYGFTVPMDEAQARVAIDLSGRPFAVFSGSFPRDSVGGLPTELVEHFFRSLAETLGAALHIEVTGENAHHMVEACFKGTARALRQAFARSGNELPSTKGTL